MSVDLAPDEVAAAIARVQTETQGMEEDIAIPTLLLDSPIRGVKSVDVADSLIAAEVTRTIEGASTVNMTIHDPERYLLNSDLMYDDDGELRSIDVRIDDLWFRLVKMSKQGDDLALIFEDRMVAWLRAKKGPRKAASRAKVTRAEYILQLVRAVKAEKIPIHIHELHKAQQIRGINKREREQIKNRRRSKGFDKGTALDGKEGTLNTTELANAARVLSVAEDLNSPELATLALICACIVEAPDFANPRTGEGTSAGILQLTSDHFGGSVQKRRDIELVVTRFLKGPAFTGGADGAIALARKHPNWTPGQIAQTIQGSAHPSRYDAYRGAARRILKEWGGTGGDTKVFSRYEFRVNKKETYWDAIQRLAQEVKWRAFVTGGAFYYISEEDLFKSKVRFRFSEQTDGVTNIDFDHDHRKKVVTARVQCRINRWAAPPGTVVYMVDMGPATGKWLVQSVRRNLFSSDAEITLKKPMRERKEPRPPVLTGGDGPLGPASKGWSTVVTTDDGAKGIVDQAFIVASTRGGTGVYVGSDYRPGDRVGSGQLGDHSSNDAYRAARDIGVRGINLLLGPFSPKLDKGLRAIGELFSRPYGDGNAKQWFLTHGGIDEFHWRGFRVQIIAHTPKWGGHEGHIHIGARWDSSGKPPGADSLFRHRPTSGSGNTTIKDRPGLHGH